MTTIKQQKLLRNPPSLVQLKKVRAYKWLPATLSLSTPVSHLDSILTKKDVSNSLVLKAKDKKIDHLLKLVKKFNHVKSFSVDVSLNFAFTDKDLIKLSKCLNSHLKHLDEFQLFASNAHSKLTNTGISYLRKRIIRLRKDTLGFARIDKLTDAGIVSLSKGLSNMNRVSEFHIDLSECENIGDSILTLANSLKTQPSLQKLTVSLTNCHIISKEVMIYLLKAITQLSKLNYLQTDFTAYVDENTWLEILTTFDSFQNLTYFGSNFEIRPITNKRLDEFSTKICTLSNLKTLSLKFLLCYELSDEGIAHLCRNLTQMKSLEHLTLEIWRTEESTDRGIEFLAQYISQMKSLRSLKLGFYFFSNLTNKGLVSLYKIPKELGKLNKLYFTFKSCDKFDMEDIHNFQKEIYKYNHITDKKINM